MEAAGVEGLNRHFVSGRLADDVSGIDFLLTDGTTVAAHIVEGPEALGAPLDYYWASWPCASAVYGRLRTLSRDGGRTGRGRPGARAASPDLEREPNRRPRRASPAAGLILGPLTAGVRSDGVVEPTYFVQIADPEDPERWHTVARVEGRPHGGRGRAAAPRAPTCGRP